MGDYPWRCGISDSNLVKRWDGVAVIWARLRESPLYVMRVCLKALLARVLAQVSATVVKPRDDRPYEGFLLINSEISPMASSVFEAGRWVILLGARGGGAELGCQVVGG